jgi:hypothetical protein
MASMSSFKQLLAATKERTKYESSMGGSVASPTQDETSAASSCSSINEHSSLGSSNTGEGSSYLDSIRVDESSVSSDNATDDEELGYACNRGISKRGNFNVTRKAVLTGPIKQAESSTGSSSASPWDDDSDSSSSSLSECISYDSPIHSECIEEDIEKAFDEARSRMITQGRQQQRRQQYIKHPKQRIQPPSTVILTTQRDDIIGRNPENPIDVTDADLDNVCLEGSLPPDVEIAPPRLGKGTILRVVDLQCSPLQRERCNARTTAPSLVESACTIYEDETSTLEDISSRKVIYHNGRPIYYFREDKLDQIVQRETKKRRKVHDDESSWLGRRSDTEIFFIGLIVVSLVVLIVLCLLILMNNEN